MLHAVLLGALADAALRNAQGGLGWTIWIAAVAATAFSIAVRRGAPPTREQSAWLLLAVACAAAVAWRDAESVHAGNVLGTLAALALFAMSAAGLPAASILSARVRDVILAFVYSARDAVAGAPPLILREARLAAWFRDSAFARRPVLRAAVLTVPLLIVFTALLSRADPVFASIFELPNIDVGRLASHVVVAGVFAWASAGWMRGALLGTARRTVLPDEVPLRLGVLEITTSLGALVALFATFVGLQLRWLFGGADVVLATTGLSISEYARRGFFELVAVAALVLPVVLVTRAMALDDATLRRHRRLSYALLILLAAIMLSAGLRMRLYVTHFGLTTDRLYASAFMVWLAIVFAGMALTVLRGRGRRFAALAVLSAFATLLALDAGNPEAIVARVNLARSSGAREVDYPYLARLRGDAAPIVARALTSAAPAPGACGAARLMRRRWLAASSTRWNWGASKGRRAVLERLTPEEVLRLCSNTDSLPGTR